MHLLIRRQAPIPPPICVCTLLKPVGTALTLAAAEEIRDASRILPIAMMVTVVLNGVLGFVMLVTFCFCITDVQTALNTPTGYPFIAVFHNATNSNAGTTGMTCILIVLTVCGCISNVATASRQLFAFARDNGLPFSSFLAYVSHLPHSHP